MFTGDGGRGAYSYEAWEDHGSRGSGGGYSSRGSRSVTYGELYELVCHARARAHTHTQTNLSLISHLFISDESYLNQVLGKLDQCVEPDKCIRIARQLLEMLESTEQRVIQVNSLFSFFSSSSSSSSCLCTVLLNQNC